MSAIAPPVVEFIDIAKTYGSTPVLRDFHLSVVEGEFLTLLGPSGCGKTTLLRLLAGFETPTHGEIRIDGRTVTALPPAFRPVNTVFQSYALFPHLSVFDNIAFGLRMQGVAAAAMRTRVTEALVAVRLADCGGRKPHQLSGGQQQRVALARALVNRPRVLLLDEPLSALDHALRRAMQTELKALQRQLGITFVFVTHDQAEALSLSDRIVVLRGGVVEQIGPPPLIYQQPASRFVAEFVGDSNLLDGVLSGRLDGQSVFAVLEGTACVLHGAFALPAGGHFTLLLRPEAVRLVAADAHDARLQGTLAHTLYKGAAVDAQVLLDNGKPINCLLSSTQAVPASGQRVGLAWDTPQARLLP